jgi:HAD superfamily hydrolase (TIGR01509 family)
MIMQAPKAVIFDMDGLMLDTEPRYREAWIEAAAECGSVLSDEAYSPVIGRTLREGEQYILEHFGADFPLEQFRAACRRLERIHLEAGPLPKKPGLEALIAFLESRRIPLAVATSTTRDMAPRQLEAAGLLHHFNAIATGDEIEHGKPAPDLFLLAASRLGIDPADCLVLEDSAAGVAAAHAAGMPVFMVPDLLPPSEETRRLATAVSDSLDEVRQALSHIGEPIGNPGRGQQHVEQPGAPVDGLPPSLIRRIQSERAEHGDRDQEPVMERREADPSAGHTGNEHDY